MSIVRIQHDKEKPYVMLNRQAIQDPLISWEAKGLWTFLLSLPDTWEVSVTHLANVYKGSKRGGKRDRIYAMLKELQEFGYVQAIQKKAEKGRFAEMDYIVYESKQIVQEAPKELKKRVPKTVKPYTDKPFTVIPTQTINNDIEELSKRNDIIDTQDRSFDKQPSIGLFDPFTYKLVDGTPLTLRCSRAFAKYQGPDKQKLLANVYWYEMNARAGTQIRTTHEKYLQWAIKTNQAEKLDQSERNDLYARFCKEDRKLRGLNILKTVVQMDKFNGEPPISISKQLPHQSFCDALDSYIRYIEERDA